MKSMKKIYLFTIRAPIVQILLEQCDDSLILYLYYVYYFKRACNNTGFNLIFLRNLSLFLFFNIIF